MSKKNCNDDASYIKYSFLSNEVNMISSFSSSSCNIWCFLKMWIASEPFEIHPTQQFDYFNMYSSITRWLTRQRNQEFVQN